MINITMSKEWNNMYLLVTPAKNEENNLPKLIDSIMKQTIKPNLWVIVDDNSNDKTTDIIKNACSKNNWIKTIKLSNSLNYDWLRYGHVVNNGFQYAIDFSTTHGIVYDFLGILDADIFPNKDYFELLITKLNCDLKIGIISGTLFICKKGLIVPEDDNERPRGGARLYRKACFKQIGGFNELPSPDSVSDLKALNRGWILFREKKAKAFHSRKSSSVQGLWRGYKKMGEGRYFLNYHPYNAFLTSIYLTKRSPFYLGIAYIYGYATKMIRNGPKTSDSEVSKYNWESWERFKMKLLGRSVRRNRDRGKVNRRS